MISFLGAEGGHWVWPETRRPSSWILAMLEKWMTLFPLLSSSGRLCGGSRVPVLTHHRPTRPGGGLFWPEKALGGCLRVISPPILYWEAQGSPGEAGWREPFRQKNVETKTGTVQEQKYRNFFCKRGGFFVREKLLRRRPHHIPSLASGIDSEDHPGLINLFRPRATQMKALSFPRFHHF